MKEEKPYKILMAHPIRANRNYTQMQMFVEALKEVTNKNIELHYHQQVITEDEIVSILYKNTELIHYMPQYIGPYNEMMGDKYLGRQSDVIHSWKFNDIAKQLLTKMKGVDLNWK
jgi:hypothetical protein